MEGLVEVFFTVLCCKFETHLLLNASSHSICLLYLGKGAWVAEVLSVSGDRVTIKADMSGVSHQVGYLLSFVLFP